MRILILALLASGSPAFAGPAPKVGSAFDLYTASPVPGSKGRLVADGPSLRFEKDPKGTRRRFVGTNLTGTACFPTSDGQSEAWASDLARRGYNLIRFHHIDWVIRANGWGYKRHADRFIASLKKRGIMVTVDLFSEGNSDFTGYKHRIVYGDPGTRRDWESYAKRLLTEPSGHASVRRWAEEPAIMGIALLNEDDPRYIGNPPSGKNPVRSYAEAFDWMARTARSTGYKGLLWSINSGLGEEYVSIGRRFGAEDFHIYWDHPRGEEFLETTGVRQWWQLYKPKITTKPLICTEWGSLAYNSLRGETGLFFAGEFAAMRGNAALSYALATNSEQMDGRGKGPIDQYAFHTDPIRLATDRAMAILLRKPQTNLNRSWNRDAGTFKLQSDQTVIRAEVSPRRASTFFASLDNQPLTKSKRLLLMRLGDAQNTGFRSRVVRDQVVRVVESKGGGPVREIVPGGSFEFRHSGTRLRAYSLDSYTGARIRELPVRSLGAGRYRVAPTTLNTEVVAGA